MNHIAAFDAVKTAINIMKMYVWKNRADWCEDDPDAQDYTKNKPDISSNGDALITLAVCDILTPVYQDGVFYTDNNGAIYIL